MNKDNNEPSGSLPQRYIGKLRSLRHEIDEIIGYLQRIDGTSGSFEVETNSFKSGRPGGHIVRILDKGPATTIEIRDALIAGGRDFGDDPDVGIQRVKQSLSQMENAHKVRKIHKWEGDPKDYPGKWENIK